MSHELLKKAAERSMKKDVPKFAVGDTVNVSCRIVEGDKERIQVFSGTVIARKGSGISETFTVRRMVANEGVERIFPLHSPNVAGVEVVRGGRTRRSKLYYLRERVGKATRLKDTGVVGKAGAKAPAGRESPAEAPAGDHPKSQDKKPSDDKE